MELIPRNSLLWNSLSDDTQDLINTGETVLQFVYDYRDRTGIVDYSFCVFSFAKAYEGYLKRLFLKMGFIKSHEYYGDEIRIGRILSPYFANERENIFYRICNHPKGGSDLSNILWDAWKQSRNLVFHYYPHNFRKLGYDEAFKAITRIIDAMNFAAERCAQVEQGKLSKKEIEENNKKQREKAIKEQKSKRHGTKGKSQYYYRHNNKSLVSNDSTEVFKNKSYNSGIQYTKFALLDDVGKSSKKQNNFVNDSKNNNLTKKQHKGLEKSAIYNLNESIVNLAKALNGSKSTNSIGKKPSSQNNYKLNNKVGYLGNAKKNNFIIHDEKDNNSKKDSIKSLFVNDQVITSII